MAVFGRLCNSWMVGIGLEEECIPEPSSIRLGNGNPGRRV
jgi:hypothetical protein